VQRRRHRGAPSSRAWTTLGISLSDRTEKLYVAEAGSGGPNCVTGGEGTSCFGFTSGLSLVNVDAGTSQRVVRRLASVADEEGFGATGLDGISALGNGTFYGIMAEASDKVPGTGLPTRFAARLRAQLGRLLKFNPSGKKKVVANVGHADYLWSADHADLVPGQFPDANPYGVLAVGGSQWVVDAGSNTIDRVRPNGKVSVEQFIPNPASSDSVPTCIDRGPDGALYIGELTGGGNPPGSASVWRYAPGELTPLTQWATGLTAVTGCGFAPDGQFYATEFSTLGLDNAAPGTGDVVRVPAHSSSPITVVGGLSFPGGFAAGPDGSLYVSNWSIAPAVTGLGAVVRITT
jgi:sugar lactone lactonase YvrE